MIITNKKAEEHAVEQIAELMCVAARTAPKSKGMDNLATLIVTWQDKEQLATEMRRITQESGMEFFQRDANGVAKAALVVLLGQEVKPMGVIKPCGYCGYADCAECIQGTGLCVLLVLVILG